jgi:dUTP pyrophosphatase
METQNRIFISLNTKNAIAPYYSYPLAMGYDLFASEALTILAGRKAFVDTAVSIKIPEGMYGLTSTRLTANGMMELHPMIYDSYDSHRIRIFLTNHSATDYNIKHGERIAILNIIPMQSPTISIQQQLTETENHQHQHQDQEIR